MRVNVTLLSLLAALSSGCMANAEFALDGATNQYGEEDPAEDDMDGELSLRLDVYPSASLAGGALLDQSFELTQTVLDSPLRLRDPVTLRGLMTAFETNPYADVSVPGSDQPVVGLVHAFVPGTPMSRRVRTDELGAFDLSLVPHDDYVLAWVPEDPSELPYVVSVAESVGVGSDLSMYLDRGLPVHGQVLGPDGTPLGGVQVQAVDPLTGVKGSLATTDAEGFYLLRLYPGDYDIVAWSDQDPALPMQQLPLVVPQDHGVQLDLDYSPGRQVSVRGQVVDSRGAPVENARVRLTSIQLDGLPDASLVLEMDTPSNGNFTDDVPAGLYEVEYIPDFQDEQLSPVRLDEAVQLGDANNRLPTVTLPPRVLVQALVVDPSGVPVSGALVRARELNFDRYVFETTTDAGGSLDLWVTDAAMRWTIEPPAGQESAITFLQLTPQQVIDDGVLQLQTGELLQGSVRWNDVPASYVSIDLRDLNDRLYASAFTDEEGTFSLRLAGL